MTTVKSRRKFIQGCLATAGCAGLGLWGCRGATSGCSRSSNSLSGGEDTPPRSKQQAEPQYRASYLALEESGTLAEREDALWEQMSHCQLCPRRCGVNRLAGERGVCKLADELKVASFGPHFGEEPPLVGRNGSGTIFFSNCNLLCTYCQNWEIAHRGDGERISHQDLADIMLSLQERGCPNINLVTPSHVLPHIIKALRLAIPKGLNRPLVHNTGGYELPEVIRLLDGVTDIYMPDFKYQDRNVAARYSAGARDYPEMTSASIVEMHRQTGDLKIVDGLATRGLILRHLVLPENLAGTDRFVKWVAENTGKDTYLNMMGQYRPMHRARGDEHLGRRISAQEMEEALNLATAAGLQRLAR